MNVRDDEWSEQLDFDPRWEVQPDPDVDDEPGSRVRAVLIVAVAAVVLLVWLVVFGLPGS
jgi:hypothetical protein